jgi:hypothetical protein
VAERAGEGGWPAASSVLALVDLHVSSSRQHPHLASWSWRCTIHSSSATISPNHCPGICAHHGHHGHHLVHQRNWQAMAEAAVLHRNVGQPRRPPRCIKPATVSSRLDAGILRLSCTCPALSDAMLLIVQVCPPTSPISKRLMPYGWSPQPPNIKMRCRPSLFFSFFFSFFSKLFFLFSELPLISKYQVRWLHLFVVCFSPLF